MNLKLPQLVGGAGIRHRSKAFTREYLTWEQVGSLVTGEVAQKIRTVLHSRLDAVRSRLSGKDRRTQLQPSPATIQLHSKDVTEQRFGPWPQPEKLERESRDITPQTECDGGSRVIDPDLYAVDTPLTWVFGNTAQTLLTVSAISEPDQSIDTADLSQLAGVDKNVARHHLTELAQYGFVEIEADDTYRICGDDEVTQLLQQLEIALLERELDVNGDPITESS